MNTDRNNLDWLAFQYVAGEMSPPDAEAFETRLLDDQPAREAVAAAVELCQAVEATCSAPGRAGAATTLPASRMSATWMAPAAWLAAGAAACLLVVASIQWLSAPNKSGENRMARGSSDADLELALAWSDVRQLQSEGAEADAAIEPDDDSLASSFTDELESDSSAQFDAPSWILNALAEREGESPLEEHPVN